MQRTLAITALLLSSMLLWGAAPPAVNALSLLADLAGPNEVAQARARQLLPRHGADIADELCALLSHPEERVWRAAWNTLADLAHAVSAPGREPEHKLVADALLALLQEDAPAEVRERALRLVPVALPSGHDLRPVAALLSNPDSQEQARAALRELATPNAVRALADAVSRADGPFRVALVDALAAISGDSAWVALRPMASHRDPAVRAAALRGLAASGDIDLTPLMRAARAQSPEDQLLAVEDAWLRWLEAAGMKGGNVERVMALHEELLAASPHPVIQGGALAGLARFGDERAAARLTTLLQAETPLSPQALSGLRMQQGRAAEFILRDAFPSLHPAYRAAYLTQLADRQSPLFIDTFKLAASDADTAVKRAALQGLARSGSPDAIGPLREIAADPALAADAAASIAGIAQQLASAGQRDAAGRAWLAAHELAQSDEQRSAALEGVKANPVPEAAPLLSQLLDDDALAALPIGTLAEIIPAVAAAGMADRAAALDAALHAKLGEPGAIDEIIAYANRTGQQEQWRGKLGFIRQWRVVGPFPFVMTDGFPQHIGEPNVDPAAEYPDPADPAAPPRTWQPVVADGLFAHVSLMGLLGEPEHACAYALATLRLDADTEAVLGLGSDDGVKAWVNGVPVHENNTDRGVAIDSDKVPVSLKAGLNTVLLQVTQNGGGWGFVARLSRPDGAPLVFAEEASAPPAPQTDAPQQVPVPAQGE